jgi:hypothetical protein
MAHNNLNLSGTDIIVGVIVAGLVPIIFYVMGMELLEHFVPSASRWTLEGIATAVLMLMAVAFAAGVKVGEMVAQEP